MKYDRPVWQLMHACADAMPDTFGYADVRAWFDAHYPEVGEATLRAHIVGLTEGGAAKHPQFQRRSPLFRRVERGVYSPIPLEERGEDPDAPDDEDEATDASLAVDRVEVEAAGPVDQVAYDDSLDDIAGEPVPPAPAPRRPEPPVAGEVEDESSVIPDDVVTDPTPTAAPAPESEPRGFGRLRRSRRDAAKDRSDDQVARRLGRPAASTDDELGAMYSGQPGRTAPTAADFVPAEETPAEPEQAPDVEDQTPEAATVESPEPTAPEPTAPARPRDELFESPKAPVEDPREAMARYQAEIEAERARLRAERDEHQARDTAAAEHERRRVVAEETARIQAEADAAIEAERAELAARLAEAEQFRASHGEISRRAAEEIESQRRQLLAEREEMARVAAERAAARQAATEEIEAERARLVEQNEELKRAAAEGAEARRVALKAMESERQRLVAEREQAAREAAERQRLEAERLESERAAAEQAAIEHHKAESARLTQAREEAERHAAVQSEAARRASAAAEEQRQVAAAAEAERLELLRLEAGRAEAAVSQAERLRAERMEAERVAAEEKKRARKLRKSAERSREIAAQLEAEQQERQSRERAAQQAHDEATQRRREEQERIVAAEAVRDDYNRLEREALARLEADRERAALARRAQTATPPATPPAPEPEPVQVAQPVVPAETEDEQLAREEREHQANLRAARRQVPMSQTPPGGAYIVRAPRPEDRPPLTPQVESVQSGPVPTAEPQHPADSVPAAFMPTDDDPTPVPDAILLGSAGERVSVPAPAKDSFRDLQFQLGRFDAELSGSRWFVLSSDLGLLEPDEWVSPDDDHVESDDPTRRSAWASWVVARLESLIGELDGKHVHVDAPDELAEPLAEVLSTDGAVVTTGVLPTGWARREAASSAPTPQRPAPRVPEVPEVHEAAVDDEPVIEDPAVQAASWVDARPDAEVVPFSRTSSVADHLGDVDLAIPAAAARGLPHDSGLYAWIVDGDGARDLSGALELPVRPGPLYVGQVGAGVGIDDSTSSLNDHVNLVELYGTARSSAFRTDLATALAEPLGLTSIEDARLTDWMLDHLSIAVWPTDDVDHLPQIRTAVVAELTPPLSFEHAGGSEYRRRIAELRSRLA